jgi:outer membrane protein assembly factor BamB
MTTATTKIDKRTTMPLAIAALALAATVGALPACGNFQNKTVAIEFVSYTPDENLVLFTAAGIYVYDGRLTAQQSYISYEALATPAEKWGLQASLSADGTTAAVSLVSMIDGNSRIGIFRIPDGDLVSVFELPGSSVPGSTKTVRTLALSPDGKLLFVRATVDGAPTLLFGTSTGAVIWTEDVWRGLPPVWSPDGTTLFAQSDALTGEAVPRYALDALDARTGTLKWRTVLDDYTYFNGLQLVGGGARLAGVVDRPFTTDCSDNFAGCEPVFPFWSSADGAPAMVLPAVPHTQIYGSGPHGFAAFACNATDTCAVGFQTGALDSKFVRVYKTDGTKLRDVLTKQSIDTLAVSPSGAFVTIGHPIYDGSGASVYRVEDGMLMGSRTFIADTSRR